MEGKLLENSGKIETDNNRKEESFCKETQKENAVCNNNFVVDQENKNNLEVNVCNLKNFAFPREKRKATIKGLELHKKKMAKRHIKLMTSNLPKPIQKPKSTDFIGIKNKRKMPSVSQITDEDFIIKKESRMIDDNNEILLQGMFHETVESLSDASSTTCCSEDSIGTKETKRLCKLNTKNNRQYKNVTLETKMVLYKNEENPFQENVFLPPTKERIVKFLGEMKENEIHNFDENNLKPILKTSLEFPDKKYEKKVVTILKLVNLILEEDPLFDFNLDAKFEE